MIYSFNEGNYGGWDPRLQKYMDSLKDEAKWGGKPYSARCAYFFPLFPLILDVSSCLSLCAFLTKSLEDEAQWGGKPYSARCASLFFFFISFEMCALVCRCVYFGCTVSRMNESGVASSALQGATINSGFPRDAPKTSRGRAPSWFSSFSRKLGVTPR
jgi:hypothetical protein